MVRISALRARQSTVKHVILVSHAHQSGKDHSSGQNHERQELSGWKTDEHELFWFMHLFGLHIYFASTTYQFYYLGCCDTWRQTLPKSFGYACYRLQPPKQFNVCFLCLSKAWSCTHEVSCGHASKQMKVKFQDPSFALVLPRPWQHS